MEGEVDNLTFGGGKGRTRKGLGGFEAGGIGGTMTVRGRSGFGRGEEGTEFVTAVEASFEAQDAMDESFASVASECLDGGAIESCGIVGVDVSVVGVESVKRARR